MSSAVAELESGLQAMLSLKPPGVSGSRINSLTALCTANIQSESVLVQKLYTQFKKAPPSHKLGVLYVVDSVTRKWLDQAKANGQTINSSAEDGTYAAGVHKVTELLPALMNDIIQTAPAEQKDKIRKLVEIWEKGQTFPAALLAKFKAQLNTTLQRSTTPDGTPPRNFESSLGVEPKAPAPTADTSSILQALANMARQNTTASPSIPSVPAQESPYKNSSNQNNPTAQTVVNVPFPPLSTQTVNHSMPPSSAMPGNSNGAMNHFNSQPVPALGGLSSPPSVAGAATIDPAAFQQQILILKTLAEQGVPQDQWAGILAALTAASNGNSSNVANPSQFTPPTIPLIHSSTGWTATRPEETRDRNSYQDASRAAEPRFRRNSRSVSPQRAWTSRDGPKSHHDGGYGDYDGNRNSTRNGRDDDYGRGGRSNEYRQRSPPGHRGRSPSPAPRWNNFGPPAEKFVEFDASIPEGHVKVLSRTLFVGGVTSSEQELRKLFSAFGQVQSCIVNREKRHAFIKMASRRDAIAAKDGMEHNRSVDPQGRARTCRWGVGFGPRDCCNYQEGISIIPIHKLTEADRKWMLTAEYGGTGGKPLNGGMVVEEPDIEIGQGVSSKAISRRMETGRGGYNGQRSGRDTTESPPSRFRKPDRRQDEDRNDRGGVQEFNYGSNDKGDHKRGSSDGFNGFANFSSMQGFPAPFPTLPNGMPMFPPGFPPGRN